MNLSNNKELLDRLAMSYALGTLRGGARRRLEALSREQPNIRAVLLIWQTQIASLTELQLSAKPDDAVWWRIRQQVAVLQEQKSMFDAPVNNRSQEPRWWQNLRLWQGAAIAMSVAAVAVSLSRYQIQIAASEQVASLRDQLQVAKNTAQKVQYVAVLVDQKATEAILVTFDADKNRVGVKRVSAFKEDSDKSLQLWALGANAKPKSLGVLSAQELEQVMSSLFNPELASALAVSLEPKGGVPEAGGPTGPVLFKGALLKTPM